MNIRSCWKANGIATSWCLMSFPDEAAFHAWANSPDYLEISRDRKAGAEAIVLLAKGFTP